MIPEKLTATWLKFQLPGHKFCAFVDRMNSVPKAAQPEESIHICVKIIEEIREIPGIADLHLMTLHWPKAVPEIVSRVGMYPRLNNQIYLSNETHLLNEVR